MMITEIEMETAMVCQLSEMFQFKIKDNNTKVTIHMIQKSKNIKNM